MVISSRRGVAVETEVVKVEIYWMYLPTIPGLELLETSCQGGVEEFTENGSLEARIPTVRFVPEGCKVGLHETEETTTLPPVSRTFER